MKSGPGFGYGFIVAWAFVMSFFTLLCGLIIEGFKDVVVTQLEQRKLPHAMHAMVSPPCVLQSATRMWAVSHCACRCICMVCTWYAVQSAKTGLTIIDTCACQKISKLPLGRDSSRCCPTMVLVYCVGMALCPCTKLITDLLCCAEDGWTTVMSGAFKATYGFAYVVCVMFILFFLTLLIFQGAVTRELGICKSAHSDSICGLIWSIMLAQYVLMLNH